jgi:hypothetical protein
VKHIRGYPGHRVMFVPTVLCLVCLFFRVIGMILMIDNTIGVATCEFGTILLSIIVVVAMGVISVCFLKDGDTEVLR